jgi:hypothetical protein
VTLRNASTDLIRQRAVERERSCEASQNTCPGMTERMQFTFRVGLASLAPVALSEFGTGPRIGFGRRRGPSPEKVYEEDNVAGTICPLFGAVHNDNDHASPPTMSVSPQPGSAPVASYITSPRSPPQMGISITILTLNPQVSSTTAIVTTGMTL